MMTRRRSMVGVAAGVTGLASMMLAPSPASAAHDPGATEVYTATLAQLNNSGTTGEVTAVRNGNTVTVAMQIEGAAANLPHPQHIHGMLTQAGSCPTIAADTDEDGFISTVEGIPSYGEIQSTLSLGPDYSAAAALTGPFPTADAEGSYTYVETFQLSDEQAAGFDNLEIVVHGIDIDKSGSYDGDKKSSLTDEVPFEVTVPAACGGLEKAAPGALAQSYTGTLGELNNTGATGTVNAIRVGTNITLALEVSGVSPGLFHPQHVHGTLGTSNGCPPPSADTDKDGFISVAEGIPFYGAIQTTLATGTDFSPDVALSGPFPVADESGEYSYVASFNVTEKQAADFGNLHVVIHGIDIDDSTEYDGAKRSSLTDDLPFEATVPTACGNLTLSNLALTGAYAGASAQAGTIVRSYLTLLDREPDTTGFNYFKTELDNGASLLDLYYAVAISAEFDARFGSKIGVADTGEYVDFVYSVVFERPTDTEGRKYWIGELDAGRIDRTTMLVYFAESMEFQNLTSTS